MYRRKAAETHETGEFLFQSPFFGVCFPKIEIFRKSKWKNAERDVSSRQISRDFARHHPRIRASDINIGVKTAHQRVYSLFPRFNFLNFIKKNVCFSVFAEVSLDFVEEFNICHVLVFKRIKPVKKNLLSFDPAFSQSLAKHLHDCRFAATPDAGKNLHKRRGEQK